jgi:hypothetical protein
LKHSESAPAPRAFILIRVLIAAEIWVTVKAKTTDKATRQVNSRRWGFRASPDGVTLGTSKDCGINVPDNNLTPLHGRIFLNAEGRVAFDPLSRVYLLIGQGERSNGPVALERGQVVKLGACSLEVSDTCATSADHEARMRRVQSAAAASAAKVSGRGSGVSSAVVAVVGAAARLLPEAAGAAALPSGSAGHLPAASDATAASGTTGLARHSYRDSALSAAEDDADGVSPFTTPGAAADAPGGAAGATAGSPVDDSDGGAGAAAMTPAEELPPVPESQWREARSDRVCYICLEGDEDSEDEGEAADSSAPRPAKQQLYPSPCIW